MQTPHHPHASLFGGINAVAATPMHSATLNMMNAQQTPMMHHHAAAFVPTTAAVPSHPFSLPSSTFGNGLLSEHSIHLPTATSQLHDSGFTRSAFLLAECALTSYPSTLEQARNALHSGSLNKFEYSLHRPTPLETSSIPPPAALALFGQCCYSSGEYRRASQYYRSALYELQKLKRSSLYAQDKQVASMNLLNSPEREWTLAMVDCHLAVQEEAQAQKLLEQMWNFAQQQQQQQLVNGSSNTNNNITQQIPVKYLLQLARLYSAPPTSAGLQSQSTPLVPGQQQQSYLTHNPKSAIAIHTYLIGLQPLALESGIELIKLNVDPRPVFAASFVKNYQETASRIGTNTLQAQCHFIYLFLTSLYSSHLGRYEDALSFTSGGLNYLTTLSPRSTYLFDMKAQAQVLCEDSELAIKTLERLHVCDPYSLTGLDLLAFLYYRRGAGHGTSSAGLISNLMNHALRIDESRSESWLISALNAAVNNQREKCLKYLEKALMMSPASSATNTVQSWNSITNQCLHRIQSTFATSIPYMIKGYILLGWEQSSYGSSQSQGILPTASPGLDQACHAFKKSLLLHPGNLLSTGGLAQAYLLQAQILTHSSAVPGSLHTHRSYQLALALVHAPVQLTQHARNPRVFTNYGLILSASSEGRQKAAKILHKTVQVSQDYSEALIALSDMYSASRQYDDALATLMGFVKRSQARSGASGTTTGFNGGAITADTPSLGTRDYFLLKIGQVHALRGDIEQAMLWYKQARQANPTSSSVKDAIMNLERDAKAALEQQMMEQEVQE